MIKKNSIFKWGHTEHEAFDLIKQAILNAPSLATPNFSNHFILYTFASKKSYVVILTHVNGEKVEARISFFISNFQGVELNYLDVEQQAFAIFQSIMNFRHFLLKTHTKVVVPFSVVRNLLIQRDVGERRENWVIALQEYEIEIRLAKIVKGQGFYRMLARASNLPALKDSVDDIKAYKVSLNDTKSKYDDIIFYLKNGYAPMKLSYKRKRDLRLKAR